MKKLASVCLAISLLCSAIIMFDISKATDYDGNFLFVGGNGPGNYSRIQDAIDNTSNGDTVFVYNGTYYENIIINKSINIIGQDKNNTIINGSGIEDVVYTISNWINISEFTIENSGNNWPSDSGIDVRSNHVNISDIIVKNSHVGIYFYNCSSNIIYNNSFFQNFEKDIRLDFSNSNTILKNVANGSISIIPGGINFGGNNRILNNIIRGYLTINSKNNFVRNNTLGRGINTYPLVINDIDSSNTVNGKPIYYFVNKTGLTVPSDAAEIILINCSLFEITNLNLSENAPGIILGLSDNNLIHNNIINNGNHGIRLLQSCNNIISKNCIQDNIVAIAILSESNHNIINVNRLKGVYTKPNFIGRGIEIVYSNNNLVYNNIIQGFFEYGIWLYADSINNSFHHNNLIQNRINARDECSNIWNNGYPSGGNYWSDFHNESQGAYDNNSDGIVDSPYSIPGGENQDRYPLIYPFEDTNPPTIDILKPTNAVYFRNKEIVPFFLPLIIGDIQICFLAGDNESGLDYTELFINNELKVTFTSVPKSWLWNEITLFKIRHTIRLIAYDNAGNNAITELIVIRFL